MNTPTELQPQRITAKDIWITHNTHPTTTNIQIVANLYLRATCKIDLELWDRELNVRNEICKELKRGIYKRVYGDVRQLAHKALVGLQMTGSPKITKDIQETLLELIKICDGTQIT